MRPAVCRHLWLKSDLGTEWAEKPSISMAPRIPTLEACAASPTQFLACAGNPRGGRLIPTNLRAIASGPLGRVERAVAHH